MDGPGHGSRAWSDAQPSVCPQCGRALPAAAGLCPGCNRPYSADDALTILGDVPTPLPVLSGDASADATRFAAPNDAVTGLVAPDEDATRFVGPETQGEVVTHVVAPDEDVTRFVAPETEGEDVTHLVAPEDARTVAGPVTPTAPRARGRDRRGAADTGPLEVGQSFGPRYHIIRMLGVGGMGAVYQAWDAELGVAVAIKVIRPEVMEDPVMAEEVSRRFKRELLLARQVTHKNVVRIHDLGDIDGIKYITMSYVEGTDLSTILKRDGKQPIANVLRLARSVISGLVAAHTAGVVHRDLKPANIMIGADGEALIMDFGIAHSTSDTAAPTSEAGALPEHLRRAASHHAATTLGSIVGTLEYMAPEQAKGQPIDQRADVYAFGLILYDILLGRRRASSGQSAAEELQRRMTSPPPPLQALEKDIPTPVAELVARCVEPDADKRFQTSGDVAVELDRLDDRGQLIPIKKTIGLPQMAAVIALLTVVFGGAWWYFYQPIPVVHNTVKVLIADFENTTGDQALTGTLEPMIRLALEEAGFITATDRTQIRSKFGVDAPAVLNAAAASTLAANQGVGVVVTGAIARRGSQFEVSTTATDPFTGTVVTSARERARTREEVLAAATGLANEIREALGDDTSDSTRRFAADTLSATKIEVIRDYATAMQAQADGKFEVALANFQKALDGDADFGLAYAGMASASRNLERPQDAEKYAREAARHVGRMTERERYRARGLFYMATGEYQQCLSEFSTMLKKYAADVVAYNNLAFCQTQLRQMPDAVEALRSATRILPNRALYRLNLALYLAYAGEFAGAETEAVKTQELKNPLGLQPQAYAQVGQGKLADAVQSYQALMKVGAQGATIATSGLADIAVYEGRFADAVKIYQDGIKVDLERKNADRAAAKLAGLAYAELQRGRTAAAREAAAQAVATSPGIRPRLFGALVLVDTGDVAAAQTIAARLATEPQAEAKASAKVIEGAIARQRGNLDRAAAVLEEATKVLDSWVAQFEIGRVHLAAGRFTPADSAFDRCVERSGELFLDEEPIYGRLPAVYYLQGKAREAQKIVGYADLYQHYLRIREKAGEDPNLKDVRARVAAQPGR